MKNTFKAYINLNVIMFTNMLKMDPYPLYSYIWTSSNINYYEQLHFY